jgi:membrane-bound metal-dependent hydrolase YbcI (DUF457 family)
MALCFSHTAAGILGYEAIRPAGPHRPALLAAAVLLANAPDLDFLPGLAVGRPGLFHRGVTHTLAAVAVVAAVVWLGAWIRGAGREARRQAGLWAGAVYASHLLLDFFTVDARPPHGGPFLWPFSDAFHLSPVTPLGEIVIDGSARGAFFRSLVRADTVGVWAAEVSILAVTVAAIYAARGVRARMEARVPGVPEES